MDGRTVNDDAVGRGGCSVDPGTSPTSETFDEGTGATLRGARSESFSSSWFGGVEDRSRRLADEEWEEADPLLKSSEARRTLLLERDRSYVHAATLSLFTHVAHGCLASHFYRWNKSLHFVGLARYK
jgi:hypothetical protein